MRSFGGEWGGPQKIILDHRGEGGGQDGPKKDHIIFERSLRSAWKQIIYYPTKGCRPKKHTVYLKTLSK